MANKLTLFVLLLAVAGTVVAQESPRIDTPIPQPIDSTFMRDETGAIVRRDGLPVIRGGPFTVNTTADTVDVSPGNGTCADSTGACSLRAAIMEANTSTSTTINIPAGKYYLTLTAGSETATTTDASTRDLDITASMTLQGSTTGKTVIIGNSSSRVFHVTAFANIFNVEIRNGQETGNGGGVFVAGGDLLLSVVFLYGNSAAYGGGAAVGSAGKLYVVKSSVISNSTSSGSGGIDAFGVSTLLYVYNSTIAVNSTVHTGGGVAVEGEAGAYIYNASIGQNSVTDPSGLGGGLRVAINSTVVLRNTAIGYNNASTGPECSGTISSNGSNAFESTAGCSGVHVDDYTGDLRMSNLSYLPKYPYPMYGLLPGSALIDGGSATNCQTPDPTGTVRPMGTACDIGTYEYILRLVGNGSFEQPGTTPKLPAFWVTKGLGSKDRRRCDSSTSNRAFSGVCVFEFKGAPGKIAKLIYTADYVLNTTGMSFFLTAGVRGKNVVVGGKVQAKITYVSPTAGPNGNGKDKLSVVIPTGTYGYQWLDASKAAAGNIQKVKVFVIYGGASGIVRVDGVDFAAYVAGPRGESPLPVPPPLN